MDKQEMLNAWETRKTAYANQWKTGLCNSCFADPCCCCVSLFCAQCASYSLRKRALYNNMANYRCCGGFLPCSGKFGESSCPEFCLCLEAFCCFGTSVAVTRWMIQDELRIQNSPCDNCLLATTIFMQQLACMCQIAACLTQMDALQDLADIISFIADVLWCSVCACMQTQHKVQLDLRDQTGGGQMAVQQGGYMSNQPPMQPPMPHQSPMYDRDPQYASGYPQGGYTGAPQYPPPGYPTQPQPYYPQQQPMYR